MVWPISEESNIIRTIAFAFMAVAFCPLPAPAGGGGAPRAPGGPLFPPPPTRARFALLAPNGAGKPTTISILTTTLTPSSGSILIDGRDAVRDPAGVRRQVGIIFQKPSLDLNLSGEENVRFHAMLYGLYPYRPLFRMMPRRYREQVREL